MVMCLIRLEQSLVGEPIDQLKEIHDVVLQAQLKVSEAAGPSKTGLELGQDCSW